MDANDPSCPGHRAGTAWQKSHPNADIDSDNSPSFVNGQLQQANMTAKKYSTISTGVRRDGKFMSIKNKGSK